MSRANSFSEKKLGGSNRIRPSDIELEDLDDNSSVNDWNNPARMSPTLGELLKRVGDSTRIEGDLIPSTSEHRVIDMNEHGGGSADESFSNRVPSRSVPFVLSFNNLTYSVKIPTKMKLPTCFRPKNKLGDESLASSRPSTKTLLNNISGEAKDGEILAVLGASGSGKSTLIDAIANRIAKGSLKGTVTLNGEVLQSRLQKVISAYVMQDDLLYPMLTVEETLMFSAEFRLPRSLSKSKKKARVQALIDQLGLRNAANTVIGDEGHRGVSGGERRRVSIGTDIVHDPILLFLDEPTSGLDSTSAFMVIKVLQRIAQSGSIVMMSIHQPSYRILGLLDRVIFLSRGQTVFNGRPSNLPRFFEDFGHPIPENENKTEFALDFIREQEVSPAGTKSLVEFNKTWIYMNRKNSCTYSANGVDYQGLSLKEAISASISKGKLVSGATNNDPNYTSTMETFANPPWTEINVLNKRSLLNMKRMPELVGIRLGAVTITGFILATVFWHLDNSPRGLQERLGFFAFAMSTTYYTCAEALPVFLTEKFIFMRETAYNAYRRSSYVLSRSIVDLPALVLLSIAFAVITYWSVGLAGGFHGFLFFFLIILASFWAGSSFVTFLSSVINHVMVGYTVVVAVLAYFLLFSGFFMNRDRMPIYWIWFHYISLIKYPFEAVLQNEFSDKDKCFINGAQIFDTTPLKGFPMELKEKLLKSISATLGVELTPTTCVTTGMDILKDQGVTQLDKWTCLWITVAWGVFFRVLFYFCLLIGSKNKRN